MPLMGACAGNRTCKTRFPCIKLNATENDGDQTNPLAIE